MQFDNCFGECKPQSCAFMFSRRPGIQLDKWNEEFPLIFLRDPDDRVRSLYNKEAVIAQLRFNEHISVGLIEVNGIRSEVEHYFLEFIFVSRYLIYCV